MNTKSTNNVNIKASTAELRLETFRAGIKTRSRQPNKAKFKLEETKGQVWSNSLTRWVTIHRIINRELDIYYELVVDDDTGDILRECEEKLSEHQGRGSATSNEVATDTGR